MLSDKKKAKIVELWEEGLTSYLISEKLSITRNAVMGVVTRLRKKGFIFKRDEKDEHKKRVKAVREKRQEEYEKKNAQKRKEPIVEAVKPTKTFPIPVLPTRDGGIELIDLKRTSCRFIVSGDDTTVRYCGDTQDRGAYCAEHYKICYYPSKMNLEKLIKL